MVIETGKEYWEAVSEYRRPLSPITKSLSLNVTLPRIMEESKNTRIISRISDILFQEGIINVKGQSENPST